MQMFVSTYNEHCIFVFVNVFWTERKHEGNFGSIISALMSKTQENYAVWTMLKDRLYYDLS